MFKAAALKSRKEPPGKKSAGQIQARPAKKHRILIPPPQAERIRQRYVSGQSIRKIAREEGRDQGTVAKIVKSPEMQAYVQSLREKYYGLGEVALDALRRGLENSKDGRLAVEVLRSIGVIPSVEEAQAIQRPVQASSAQTEEEEVEREMLKLVKAASERAKVFGQPLPSLTDDVLDEPKPLEDTDETRNSRF